MATILTHTDGDGICAGSLVKMTKEYQDASVIFTHPMGLATDLKKLEDDLVICDIALDKRAYKEIYDRLEEISQNYSIVYLDHHNRPGSLPPKVVDIHDETVCATELAFRYFYHELPKYADRIAIIGAISDYLDKTPLMLEVLHHFERRSLFLDAGLLAQGLNAYSRSYDSMRELVEEFSKGKYPCDVKILVDQAIRTTRKDKKTREKVIRSYEKGKMIAWVMNPHSSKSKAAHWIMGDSGSVVGLTIINHRSRPNIVDITLRGRNLVDLRNIVPKIAHNLGGSGGGHANALGCRFPKDNLKIFLRILDNTLSALEIEKPRNFEELVKLN
jgi:single-stranded-DNA-specific exonuclease